MPVHVVVVVSPLSLSLSALRDARRPQCCCDCRLALTGGKSCTGMRRGMASARHRQDRLRTRKSSLRPSRPAATSPRVQEWRAGRTPRVARGERRTSGRSLRSLYGPQRLDSYIPRCIPPLAMWPSISRGRWALLPRSLPTSNNLQTQTLPPMPP